MAEREASEDLNEASAKNDEDLETNSESILAALNCVLVLASLSSPDPDEQRPELAEIEERGSGNMNQRGKYWGSRSDFPARRHQVSGLSRPIERHKTTKVQPKIRDCRCFFIDPIALYLSVHASYQAFTSLNWGPDPCINALKPSCLSVLDGRLASTSPVTIEDLQ